MSVLKVISVIIFAGFLGVAGKQVGLRDSVLLPLDTSEPEVLSEKKEIKKEDNRFVEIESDIYFDYFKKGTEDVLLFPNLEDKLQSNEVVKKTNCKYLVNGGFYGENGNYLGLLIVDGKTISQRIASSTFNGYFNLDEPSTITGSPREAVKNSLQTGPLLITGGLPRALKLKADKEARRLVAAVDSSGELYFMVFFDKDSVFKGPKLLALPSLVEKAGKILGVNFNSAINLDGGTASAFYGEGTKLSEASLVGTFLCII